LKSNSLFESIAVLFSNKRLLLTLAEVGLDFPGVIIWDLSFAIFSWYSKFCVLTIISDIIYSCCSSLYSLMVCSSLSLNSSYSTSSYWSSFIPFIICFAIPTSINSTFLVSKFWLRTVRSTCVYTSSKRACSFSGVTVEVRRIYDLAGVDFSGANFYCYVCFIYSLHLSLYFCLSSVSWVIFVAWAFI
jgi:hypothetical protein